MIHPSFAIILFTIKKILHYLLSRINKLNRNVLYWQFFKFVCPPTNHVTLLLSHHSMSACKDGGKSEKGLFFNLVPWVEKREATLGTRSPFSLAPPKN